MENGPFMDGLPIVKLPEGNFYDFPDDFLSLVGLGVGRVGNRALLSDKVATGKHHQYIDGYL